MSRRPTIAFRTEGGATIGFGHVCRSLTLAQALSALGARCVFLMGRDQDAARPVLCSGYEVMTLADEDDADEARAAVRSAGAGAIIIDSYRFADDYYHALVECGAVRVGIDDLGLRQLPADVVVDAAARPEETRPHEWMTEHRPGAAPVAERRAASTRRQVVLAGPKYALLRPEFAEAPVRDFSRAAARILITLGGTDPFGLTESLIRWVREACPRSEVSVVIGPMVGATIGSIERAARECGGVTFHAHPRNMRSLMLAADVALCAGGQTTYELAATATPSLAIRVAHNQTRNLTMLSKAGALVWAGDATGIDDPVLPEAAKAMQRTQLKQAVSQALCALALEPRRFEALGQRGRELVDGRGAERVAQHIFNVTRHTK